MTWAAIGAFTLAGFLLGWLTGVTMNSRAEKAARARSWKLYRAAGTAFRQHLDRLQGVESEAEKGPKGPDDADNKTGPTRH